MTTTNNNTISLDHPSVAKQIKQKQYLMANEKNRQQQQQEKEKSKNKTGYYDDELLPNGQTIVQNWITLDLGLPRNNNSNNKKISEWSIEIVGPTGKSITLTLDEILNAIINNKETSTTSTVADENENDENKESCRNNNNTNNNETTTTTNNNILNGCCYHKQYFHCVTGWSTAMKLEFPLAIPLHTILNLDIIQNTILSSSSSSDEDDDDDDDIDNNNNNNNLLEWNWLYQESIDGYTVPVYREDLDDACLAITTLNNKNNNKNKNKNTNNNKDTTTTTTTTTQQVDDGDNNNNNNNTNNNTTKCTSSSSSINNYLQNITNTNNTNNNKEKDECIISDEHGSIRIMFPKLYGWKSAKWCTKWILLQNYQNGFWEQLGCHPRGRILFDERFHPKYSTILNMIKQLPGFYNILFGTKIYITVMQLGGFLLGKIITYFFTKSLLYLNNSSKNSKTTSTTTTTDDDDEGRKKKKLD